MKLYLLAGPTGAGKTDFSVDFAIKRNCEILSCDSSSVYKHMDIGTAKPSIQAQSVVKHWGIDIVMPNDHFSVYDYVTYSTEKILDIKNRGKNVLVVGGSGFYMKSFFSPVVDDVSISQNIYEEVLGIYEQFGHDGLIECLNKFNPNGFPKTFDFKNTLKVKKALERCMATGLSISQLKDKYAKLKSPFELIEKHSMLIVKPLEILKQRILSRTINMIKNGFVEEVEYLLSKNYINQNSKAAKAVGYSEVIDFITHKSNDYEQLISSICNSTTSLIKKQLTWFKYQIKFDKLLYTT